MMCASDTRIVSVPGHISNKFYALDGKRFFIRNVFMPELFFVALERAAIKDKGELGKKELYEIGKYLKSR